MKKDKLSKNVNNNDEGIDDDDGDYSNNDINNDDDYDFFCIVSKFANFQLQVGKCNQSEFQFLIASNFFQNRFVQKKLTN